MKIIKLFIIALTSFVIKHLVQAITEWTDVIPVIPKSYIWGNFGLSRIYFSWQFIYVFWIFLVVVFILYFLFKKVDIINFKKNWLYVICPIIVFVLLIFIHQFEFPFKQLYFPRREVFNFNLIEDFIVYSITSFFILKSLIFVLNKEEL